MNKNKNDTKVTLAVLGERMNNVCRTLDEIKEQIDEHNINRKKDIKEIGDVAFEAKNSIKEHVSNHKVFSAVLVILIAIVQIIINVAMNKGG